MASKDQEAEAAANAIEDPQREQAGEREEEERKKLFGSYIGLSFSLFLALLPTNSLSLIPTLQNRIRDLTMRIFHGDEQLKQMKSRRKEDSKANARVVEIFASHRNAWQAEERRLLQQIDAANEEVAALRGRVQDLEREREEWQSRVEDLERQVGEREEMIGFMSRNATAFREKEQNGEDEEDEEGSNINGGCGSTHECYNNGGEEQSLKFFYGRQQQQQQQQHYLLQQQQQQQQLEVEENRGDFNAEFLGSASKFWAEKASLWQDVHNESPELLYHMKHFVARRASPWKIDGKSMGVSSKLKLLEQELLNLEKVGKPGLSEVPSLMRKQAKRYQALAAKIDDLCGKMQASDPSEPTLSPEFRAQRQTEFLLEAFRLQQRAAETGQKVMALQTEMGNNYYGDELGSQNNFATRRSLDSIRNNLKEVQRNLEIWLARIIGDLEGILARDGASRVREYYSSRYPFVEIESDSQYQPVI